VGDNLGKPRLIPHAPFGGKPGTFGPGAGR
jgi:hypothetical protein